MGVREGGSPTAGGRAWAWAAAAAALFLLALAVRLRFHAGFVLGDDSEEFLLLRSLLEGGPSFEGHLRYRFPMWIFNYLAMRVFGLHEASFFLPTWLLSSLLPLIAFATLRAAGYGLAACVFGGAFVALSPFEVLIGTLRANDLFVEFFLALAFFAFVRFEGAPRLQGASVALLLWLAFYAKLWSLFLYPVVGLYYGLRLLRREDAGGLGAFAATSLALHGTACAFWRLTTGTWAPFLERLSATYPVAPHDLVPVLLQYPRSIFVGAEHGNTLFGPVPYLLIGALAVSIVGARVPALRARAARLGLDRYDVWLLCSCGVFFGLLEFFPNNFVFDRYYSVPRIFRYLAPLSFGLSLLTAKRLVDLAPLVPSRAWLRPLAAVGVLLLLTSETLEAVAPSRSHHARLASVREELRAACPPAVILEPVQARFFRELHLREACPRTTVRSPRTGTGGAGEHARWLETLEPRLEDGAILVSGLTQFVYYACHECGFQVSLFDTPLDSRWVLVRELPPLGFGRVPEPVRLWRWHATPGAPEADRVEPTAVPELPPQTLFERGIERFDAQDYPGTRAHMDALLARFPDHDLADDAAYFSAVTHWREQALSETIREFEAFLAAFPASTLVRAAHFHIALAHRVAGRDAEARAAFEATVRTGHLEDPERVFASRALEAWHGPAPLGAVGRALTELVYRFQSWSEEWTRFPLATI